MRLLSDKNVRDKNARKIGKNNIIDRHKMEMKMIEEKRKWRIMTVFGTRPETIKMAPVVAELTSNSKTVPIVCVTGQHREMLRQVLNVFAIKPDYDLDIMRPGQTLTDITTAVLRGMQGVLAEAKPDLVLVHGDTTTALAAALATFYAQIPLGHVEAGLRTYNKYSPYPEEMNRQMISVLADINFAPTTAAAENLRRMGVPQERIKITGNTAIDALYMSLAKENSEPLLAELAAWSAKGRLVLLTAHRRENLGDPMRHMFRAIAGLLAEHQDMYVVYPVHLNPQVQKAAREILGGQPRVKLIDPLDVLEFHHLMNMAYLILTDSGGIQEEAPALDKPVLVLRDTTERPEGVAAGTLRLVGTSEEEIYRAVNELWTNETAYREMCRAVNPYGDGHAAEYICRAAVKFLADRTN